MVARSCMQQYRYPVFFIPSTSKCSHATHNEIYCKMISTESRSTGADQQPFPMGSVAPKFSRLVRARKANKYLLWCAYSGVGTTRNKAGIVPSTNYLIFGRLIHALRESNSEHDPLGRTSQAVMTAD